MHPLLSLAWGLSMGCYREYQLFLTLLISTECCHVFEFQLLCTFLARILRSATVHCRILYYGHLGARPVSVNAFSDQVDGWWTVELSPSYARTKVRPYPYYGTACTPRSSVMTIHFYLRLRAGLLTYSSHIASAMQSLRSAALVCSSRGTAA